MANLTDTQIAVLVSRIEELECMDDCDLEYLRDELETQGLATMVQLTSHHRDTRITIQLNRPGTVHSFGFEPGQRTANQTRAAAASMVSLLDTAEILWAEARALAA